MPGHFKKTGRFNDSEILEASSLKSLDATESAYSFSNPWIKEECSHVHNEATKMLKQTYVEKIMDVTRPWNSAPQRLDWLL